MMNLVKENNGVEIAERLQMIADHVLNTNNFRLVNFGLIFAPLFKWETFRNLA